MQFNGVNNKEHKFDPRGQGFVIYAHAPGFLMLLVHKVLKRLDGVLVSVS